MTADKTTLSALLKLDSQAKVAEIRSGLAGQKEKLPIKVSVPWEQLEDKLAEKIIECFNLDLANLCVNGWKKYRELQQFADPEKYPPEEANDVALLEHEIVSEHRVGLEISFAGVHSDPINFDLSATLELRGAVLTIQGGKIKKALLGKCKGRADLKWKEITLAQAESKEVSFGQPVDLHDGIPIYEIAGFH